MIKKILLVSLLSSLAMSEDNTKLIYSIDTSKGEMKVELFKDKTPWAVKNFIGLSEKGVYNNRRFNKIINNFIIQAEGKGDKSLWNRRFKAEINKVDKFDKAGLLAMSGGKRGNGSRFFITLDKASNLNNKYTIFGKVISGIDILKSIGKERVDLKHRPFNKIFIKTIKKSNNKDIIEKTISSEEKKKMLHSLAEEDPKENKYKKTYEQKRDTSLIYFK